MTSLLSAFHAGVEAAVEKWIGEGKPAQEGFKWNNRQQTWHKAFPQHKDFLDQLPKSINRVIVRQICAEVSRVPAERFLAIMLWGYSGMGYGAFRVSQMLNAENFDESFAKLVLLAEADDYRSAYTALSKARIAQLGPSYASKVLSFLFNENPGVPILDSVVARHLQEVNVPDFNRGPKAVETWNEPLFASYVESMRNVGRTYGISANEVELAIYRIS